MKKPYLSMVLHKRWLYIIVFFISGVQLHAQTDSYIIYLKDKNGTTGSLHQPSAYLSAKSLARRLHENIQPDSTDLPVSATYITAIRNQGVEIIYSSKWLNAVHIKADPLQYASVQSLPFVVYSAGSFRTSANKNTHGSTAAMQTNYAQNFTEYLGIDAMHRQGIKGNGIMIAVTDAGYPGVDTLRAFRHLWTNNQVVYYYDVAGDEANVFNDGSHGTNILSVLAADTAMYTGVVPEADYILLRTEVDATESKLEEFNWLRAAEIADSCGADIISVSLGYTTYDNSADSYSYANMNGQSSIIAQAADMAYEKGMIVVSSAGNDGNNAWKYIGTPADAKHVLAVGSIEFNNTKSGFSSVGPTADGRIKPDLCAPGSTIYCISPDGTFAVSGGTSLATPMIAGMLAGIRQTYPYLSNDEIKRILLQSCDNYVRPTNLKGYGVPHFLRTQYYLNTYTNPSVSFIAPNPYISGELLLKVPEATAAYEIRLYDYQGAEVFNRSFLSINNIISLENNVSNLQAGIYFMYVKSMHTVEIIKWIRL